MTSMAKTAQRTRETNSVGATTEMQSPVSAKHLLSAFVIVETAPLFAAIEKALDNGSGEVLLSNDDGRISGAVTLASARELVRRGDYTGAKAADARVSLNASRLMPTLDRDGRLQDVAVDRSRAFIPVAEPHLTSAELRNHLDAFLSTWISSTGEYIGKFERAFASRCDMPHGVAVSNGTVAIHLALHALGIGPGDEVIVPDLTFAATINTVVLTGATPVIVDVDPNTWCMDPETFRRAVTSATRAVIPVHVFGRPAPMTEICAVAREHGIYVVEDCAEAHGAAYDGRPVGSFSDIATFSFFANKIITTGEGGMCLARTPQLAERMRVLRDHGMRPERRYWHEEVGFNYRMTNPQASIGCAQIERMDEILTTRASIQKLYATALAGIPGVEMPPALPERFSPVAWFACATVPAAKRPALIEACKKVNLDLRPFFNGLSMMPAYVRWARPCPVTRHLSESGVNLPTSHYVDAGIAERLAGAFRSVLG